MSAVDLTPLPGTLTARVFENENIGLAPTLFFDIEVPIAPFRFGGEQVKTAVRLEFIDFRVKTWRKLEKKAFSFPKNPEDGYIDGSLYLGGAHNPADVTKIAFGKFAPAKVGALLDIEIDFTVERHVDLGVLAARRWKVELGFDRASLDAAEKEARRRGAG
jgi:hypothetical protein